MVTDCNPLVLASKAGKDDSGNPTGMSFIKEMEMGALLRKARFNLLYLDEVQLVLLFISNIFKKKQHSVGEFVQPFPWKLQPQKQKF